MTKPKRIRIYKRAKELLIKEKGDRFSMCDNINEAYEELYRMEWEDWNMDFKIFKEFYSLKPKGASFLTFWWDKYDKEIRIKMFDQIIGEVK